MISAQVCKTDSRAPKTRLNRYSVGRQIARVLGAPVTASAGLGFVTQAAGPVSYWRANTWYYPYDPERREAIAIRFEGNRARAVDFIGGVGSACEA